MDDLELGSQYDLFQSPGLGDEPDDAGYPEPAGDDKSDRHALRGFRQRWKKRSQETEDDVVPSPSLMDSEVRQAPKERRLLADPGPSSNLDNVTSVTNAFLTGMKPSSIVLPWEQDWLRPIFGEVNPAPSLAMPAEWNAALCNPTKDVIPGVNPLPTFEPVFKMSRCIKNKADLTFLDQRSLQSKKATAKILCFLELSLEDSGVGRQLAHEDTDEGKSQVLDAVLGTKSPATVVKRMNALLHYNRWHLIHLAGCCIPLDERSVWLYLRFLHTIRAAPTKAMSFMQAIRFAYYVLLLDGAADCMNSRRLIGSAELQMALKEPTRQARPLTVKEAEAS